MGQHHVTLATPAASSTALHQPRTGSREHDWHEPYPEQQQKEAARSRTLQNEQHGRHDRQGDEQRVLDAQHDWQVRVLNLQNNDSRDIGERTLAAEHMTDATRAKIATCVGTRTSLL